MFGGWLGMVGDETILLQLVLVEDGQWEGLEGLPSA